MTNPANAAVKSGPKALLLLASPIALSQLAQIATGVVDVVMAGHLGAVSLGAVSTGAAIWMPMMIFLLGLLYGLTHAIGTRRGEGRETDIPQLVLHGIGIGLLGGIALGVLLYFIAGPLFSLASVSPELIPQATSYCRIVAFAFPGLGCFLALRFALEASNGAGLVTGTIACSIVLKITLNKLLVFGGFSLPPMGVSGFGLSTAIVFWTMAVQLTIMMLFAKRVRQLLPSLGSLKQLSPGAMGQFILKNIPIAFNFLSDYLVMAVVALGIASIGPVAISSHQITFNILSVLLMITTGIGMAGTIIISNAMGSGRPELVRQSARLSLITSLIVACALSVALFLFGEQAARIYTAEAEILLQTAPLLHIAALLFTINVAVITLGFVLRGIGRPEIPFGVMLMTHWGISIPLGYILGHTTLFRPPMGTVGWWYGLMAGVMVAVILLAFLTAKNLPSTDTAPDDETRLP